MFNVGSAEGGAMRRFLAHVQPRLVEGDCESGERPAIGPVPDQLSPAEASPLSHAYQRSGFRSRPRGCPARVSKVILGPKPSPTIRRDPRPPSGKTDTACRGRFCPSPSTGSTSAGATPAKPAETTEARETKEATEARRAASQPQSTCCPRIELRHRPRVEGDLRSVMMAIPWSFTTTDNRTIVR